MKKLIVAISLLFLSGCSTIQTSSAGDVKLSKYGTYTIKVSANPNISPLVYEFAVQELGKSLNIEEKEKGKGTIEVTFLSKDAGYFSGTSTTLANAEALSYGWYSANPYYSATAIHGKSTTVSSGGMVVWQNSTLFIVVKDENGKRLYSADYKYKGGWDMSGFSVNTPEEAARLCIQRVYKKMLEDKIF